MFTPLPARPAQRRLSFRVWRAPSVVSVLLVALLLVGCNAGCGSLGRSSGNASEEGPVLRLYGEMPPEMGLRFDLTFKATADRRECKTRSMVDGELYPAEQERTLEAYYPNNLTYQTDASLAWGKVSKCNYAIDELSVSFPHQGLDGTRGKLYISFDELLKYKKLDSHIPLTSPINFFCDVEKYADVLHPVSCADKRGLKSDAYYNGYYTESMPQDTIYLNLNLSVREST